MYLRWFQPLVASYEPLVDRRLAESKALTSEWLHSNALRLVAAMQQRALAWLASLQLQAAEAAGGGGGALPAAPAARRPAPIVEELESEEEEEEVVVVRETRSRRRAAAPAPKRASSRGGRGEGERASARGDAYAVPGDELQSRRSSFSLVSFCGCIAQPGACCASLSWPRFNAADGGLWLRGAYVQPASCELLVDVSTHCALLLPLPPRRPPSSRRGPRTCSSRT